MAGFIDSLQLENVTGVIASIAFLPEGIVVILNRTRNELYLKRWTEHGPMRDFQTVNLGKLLGAGFNAADVQLGDNGCLLVTFTSAQVSTVIIFTYTIGPSDSVQFSECHRFQLTNRVRSVSCLGDGMYAALTAPSIDIVDASGNVEAVVRRSKPDRGGFVTSFPFVSGSRRFMFGDYDQFVTCLLNGVNVTEESRRRQFPMMKRPRSCIVDNNGNMIVACDNSHNILRIPKAGNATGYDVIVQEGKDVQFGKIAQHPSQNVIVATTWDPVENGGLPRVYHY